MQLSQCIAISFTIIWLVAVDPTARVTSALKLEMAGKKMLTGMPMKDFLL